MSFEREKFKRFLVTTRQIYRQFNRNRNRNRNAIHGFTISVPVLILPVFRKLLNRNGKNVSNFIGSDQKVAPYHFVF